MGKCIPKSNKFFKKTAKGSNFYLTKNKNILCLLLGYLVHIRGSKDEESQFRETMLFTKEKIN